MVKGKKPVEDYLVSKELCDIFPVQWLRDTAKETGLIKRERKIAPEVMFWVLALGYGVLLQRSLAGLKRVYERGSKEQISDSSWYYRFTPELVAFLKACVVRGMEYLAQKPSRTLDQRLDPFADVLIQDSTIVRLHDVLAEKWPAARSRRVAAGVKVATLVSAVSNGPKSVALFAEKTSELKTLRIGPWVKDRIILIDLGFYKYQLFTRIKENGGSFVTRMKKNANPLIISDNLADNNCDVQVKDRHLKDVISELNRKTLDVEIEVPFKRRKYKGKQRKDSERFRLVAIYSETDEKYHLYITNISLDVLNAEEIVRLYGARWEIELVFKELKSRYKLDVIETKNPQAIEAFIWIAILTLFISRRLYTIIRRLNPGKKMVRYTQLRWSTIFSEHSSDILTEVLYYVGIKRTFLTDLEVLQSQALDPHVNRRRLTEDLWS